MKSKWIGKSAQGRSTFQTITHHLMVDIIPTLLFLVIMALAMAAISSKLTTKPLISESAVQTEKVS